jgi:sugar phosphate isomerase/epimerase
MLTTIRDVYGVRVITVHPQRGPRRHARSLYRKIEERIAALDIIIAYETFEKHHEDRKWISQVEDMHDYFDALKLPFLGVTYDFTHSENPRNLQEVRHFHRRIHAVHFSDARSDRPLDDNEKHQHLALGYGDYAVLEFLQVLQDVGYAGFLILEYLPAYREYLRGDVELLDGYIQNGDPRFVEVVDERRKNQPPQHSTSNKEHPTLR